MLSLAWLSSAQLSSGHDATQVDTAQLGTAQDTTPPQYTQLSSAWLSMAQDMMPPDRHSSAQRRPGHDDVPSSHSSACLGLAQLSSGRCATSGGTNQLSLARLSMAQSCLGHDATQLRHNSAWHNLAWPSSAQLSPSQVHCGTSVGMIQLGTARLSSAWNIVPPR